MKNTDWDTLFRERTVHSEDIFEGKVLHLFRDEIALPDGTPSVREYAKHRGAVAVVALDEKENIYLVRQYRYAIGRTTVEIPAGKLEEGELNPEEAARRELSEEIGAKAGKLSFLGAYLASPAILTERIYCYLAEELSFGAPHPDEDENISVLCMPLCDAVGHIERGEWEDGKTLFAVLKTCLLKRKG